MASRLDWLLAVQVVVLLLEVAVGNLPALPSLASMTSLSRSLEASSLESVGLDGTASEVLELDSDSPKIPELDLVGVIVAAVSSCSGSWDGRDRFRAGRSACRLNGTR